MTFDEYRAIDAVNFSTLRHMARSPKHYLYRSTHDIEDTGPMRFGRAVHCSVLEPDQFPLDFGVYDGARRGKDWTEFAAVNEARTILTRAEYDTCLRVRDAVRNDPVAGPYFDILGMNEVALRWTDSGTSLDCKARLDRFIIRHMPLPNTVLDLKTTRDAGPDEFAKTAARLKYAHQMAMYCMGAEAVYGDKCEAVIIAVESEAPHDVCTYKVSEQDLETATYEVRDLLQRVADCTRSGEWPGRFTKAETLAVPWWAFEQDDSEFDLTGLGIFKGEK